MTKLLDIPQNVKVVSTEDGTSLDLDLDKIYITGYNVHGQEVCGTATEVNKKIAELNAAGRNQE